VQLALSLAALQLRNRGSRRSVVDGVKHFGWALVLVVGVAACSGGPSSATPTTPPSTTTSTSIGRAVTTPLLYRSGLMRLDPSGRAKVVVSAARALAIAGGAQPGDTPLVLLGRLTVFDYGRETSHGLARFVDHRLVWLVVYPHHDLMIRGCRPKLGAECPRQFGRVFVPVDARTGVSLGTWS
jgi:hypothetical protein